MADAPAPWERDEEETGRDRTAPEPDPKEKEEEEMLEDILTGDRTATDPEVRAWLAERPDAAARLEALRGLIGEIDAVAPAAADWERDLAAVLPSEPTVAAIDARVAAAVAARVAARGVPVPERAPFQRPSPAARGGWRSLLAVAAAAAIGVWLWSEFGAASRSGPEGPVRREPLDQRSAIEWLGPDVLDRSGGTVTIEFRVADPEARVRYRLGLVDPSMPRDERLLPTRREPRFDIPATDLARFGGEVLVRAYAVAPTGLDDPLGERRYTIR